MKANPNNLSDVKKYYSNTFIVVPEVSPHHVYRLYDYSTHGLTLKDPITGNLGFISFDGGFEYDIKSPLTRRKQWFQHEGRAYLVSRIPARMWRKGICEENTEVFTFNGEGNLRTVGISSELLNSMLSWQPPTEFTAKCDGGVALSSTFAYCPVKSQLYMWDHLVGKIGKRTQELFVPKELVDLKLPELVQKFKVMYV